MESIDGYEDNKWFFFYLALMGAAEKCMDKEYLREKYHKKLKELNLDITDDKKQKGIRM